MSGARTSSIEPSVGRAVHSVGGVAPPSSPQPLAAGGCRGSDHSRCYALTFSASGILSATATSTRSRPGRAPSSWSGGGVADAATSGRLGRVIAARELVAPAAPAGTFAPSGRLVRCAPSGWRTGTRTGTASSIRSRSRPGQGASGSGGAAVTAATNGRRRRWGAATARAAAGRARGAHPCPQTDLAHARALSRCGWTAMV
jgi:hypothetical protein